MTEAEEVWHRLTYVSPGSPRAIINFTGNGIATTFFSSWLISSMSFGVTVNGASKFVHLDFTFDGKNTITFYEPIPEGHIVTLTTWAQCK